MRITKTWRKRGIAWGLAAGMAAVLAAPAAAAPVETGATRKLSIVPPVAAVTVTPAVAAPGVARRITVGGTWPSACPPTQAQLGLPSGHGTPALGILLAEPQTFAPCAQVLTPWEFSLDYTPEAAGQVDILVLSTRATALARGTLVTGSETLPRARFDVSGAWYDPQTNGSGLMVAHDFGGSDQVFATWQVYDANGLPRWYTLQEGRWDAAGLVLEGTLYETSGVAAACVACPVPLSAVVDRGRVRLTVSVDGASGGLDAALDRLPAAGAPERLANLVRFLPARIVLP